MSFIDTAKNGLKRFADKLRAYNSADIEATAAVRTALAKEKVTGLRPVPADNVNRKDRRKAGHKLRQRTRRTGITEREPARYGWAIHQDANNKAFQFLNHGLLHSLFGKANVWSQPA